MVGRRQGLQLRPRMDLHLGVQTRSLSNGKKTVLKELPARKRERTSAAWGERQIAAFIATALDANEAGYVEAGSLKPSARDFISAKLIPQFGMFYDTSKIKNFWDRLKKDHGHARTLLLSTTTLEYKEGEKIDASQVKVGSGKSRMDYTISFLFLLRFVQGGLLVLICPPYVTVMRMCLSPGCQRKGISMVKFG